MELAETATPVTRSERIVCSICIANYNGEQLLDDCLGSVFAQQDAPSIEVIVHDDASTDGSVELISRKYPSVRLLKSPSNVGFCVANNRMVDAASGDYVLLLNNDAALFPDALRKLLQQVEPGRESILTLPQYDWVTQRLVDRGCLLDYFYNPIPNLDAARTEVAMVIGACLWIPRRLWIELGGFPTWMESIAEDLYLCSIARLRGHTVRVVADSGYRHRQGASFGGNKPSQSKLVSTMRRRRLSERNKSYALFLCTPTPAMWLLLALHAALLIAEGAVLSAWRRNPRIFVDIYWNALASLVKHRAHLRSTRSQLMSSKATSNHRYFSVFAKMPRKLSMLRQFGVPDIGT
ncbi:glycosyltransferase [Dyella sp.]|uniref:glycosyltransferase family 2 protein n=1 Tax=Dyella sp. TaxID=1869338 RepID=UPI00321788F5